MVKEKMEGAAQEGLCPNQHHGAKGAGSSEHGRVNLSQCWAVSREKRVKGSAPGVTHSSSSPLQTVAS